VSIGSLSSISTNSASSSGATTAAQLTQADFLQLMTAQLQAQDPTQPMDNSQFASQLAQFSQLSATQNMDSTMQALSSNLSTALQTSQVISSAGLVGRQVLVQQPSADLTAGLPVNGAVNVAAAGDVQLSIKDSQGKLVKVIDLGQQQSGLANFTWDGTDNNGNPVASGTYALSANNAGSSAPLNTYVAGKVSGAGFGGSNLGTVLQVAGIGSVPLNQIVQIN
jgi:flagellar basal-body rod modification protein FlgD